MAIIVQFSSFYEKILLIIPPKIQKYRIKLNLTILDDSQTLEKIYT